MVLLLLTEQHFRAGPSLDQGTSKLGFSLSQCDAGYQGLCRVSSLSAGWDLLCLAFLGSRP